MVKVLLQSFTHTFITKYLCFKIGVALEAAPLVENISVLTVSIIVWDQDAIDQKTEKNQ
jgi:hypothetical protein